MTKIIGVDLDEVLAELLDFCLEYNDFKIAGKEIKREDVKDYYVHRYFDFVNLEQAIDWFLKPILEDRKLKMPPVKGAIKCINNIKNSGYSLKVVTARKEELLGKYTKMWLEKYYPDIFDEIIFANHFSDKHKEKSEICSQKGIEIMIEDNYDYALELAENGIRTYLLSKPWNIHRKGEHQNLIRVNSWEEINF